MLDLECYCECIQKERAKIIQAKKELHEKFSTHIKTQIDSCVKLHCKDIRDHTWLSQLAKLRNRVIHQNIIAKHVYANLGPEPSTYAKMKIMEWDEYDLDRLEKKWRNEAKQGENKKLWIKEYRKLERDSVLLEESNPREYFQKCYKLLVKMREDVCRILRYCNHQ